MSLLRGLAQLGSAPALGAGGRRFESSIPDHGVNMKNLTYHGKTYEQAKWVLEYFGTPETREMNKDNLSFNEWLDECRQIVEKEHLNG